MSVVNKMLKDLEARETDASQIKADYQPPQKQPIHAWKKAAVVILIVIVILSIIWVLLSDKNSTPESNSSTPKVTVSANVPKKMTVQKVAQIEAENEDVKESTETVNPIIEQPVQPPPERQEIIQNDRLEVNNSNIAEPSPAASSADKKEKQAADESSFSMASSSKESEAIDLKAQISERLANNDINQASILLNQLINKESNNISARKKLAALFFSQGNDQQAKLLLLRSVEQFPSDGGFKLMLARLYVAQGTPNEALDVLSGFQPELSKGIEYLGYRAALAQQLNEIELARKDYQALTQLEPQNARWWLGLGITNDKIGSYDTALQSYRKASSFKTLDLSVEEFVTARITLLMEDQ
ncbi:tetratricopeptide repeat protein [Paraglaciecola sp. 2405UD69-4]|uniref:tetratricopeptide repeat protein n=1 Tax=Paraglaciecola sp. 2405UD69-4 TaxID=3391836 RepID=UPI0039C9BDCE